MLFVLKNERRDSYYAKDGGWTTDLQAACMFKLELKNGSFESDPPIPPYMERSQFEICPVRLHLTPPKEVPDV